jgi:hypothetical protein
MKKRGRPPEKSYPEPHTTAEGLDNAVYGKLGASEAMAFVRDCPYTRIDYIRSKASKNRDRVNKEYLKRGPEFCERWAARIGPFLGRKIAEGDGKFFRELANAAEEYRKDVRPIADIRRYLAMDYGLLCYAKNVPFTRKGLREYYQHHNPGETIDSSTLSKMMKWARAAKL